MTATTQAMISKAAPERARRVRFGFVLVPNYTAIGFTCAMETIRLVNEAAHEQLFECTTLTLDGDVVTASNGTRLTPDGAIVADADLDVVFVCGPNPIVFPNERLLTEKLVAMRREQTLIGAIDTGSYILARAGLLDGYRCTIHWQDMNYMRKHFPQLIVSPYIFEIDRDRATCSGGTAAVDMMLALLHRNFGVSAEIIATACDLLVYDRMRSDRDRQRVPLRHRMTSTSPKLLEVVSMMEANIEEPMAVTEMADQVNLTTRQLQRLFRHTLGCTPVRYYLQIRMEEAHHLLRTTDYLVSDIANWCGFASPSYFSRKYREHYGTTPQSQRPGTEGSTH